MTSSRQFSDAEIIAALEKTNGLIAVAARALGCARETIYRRAAKSKKMRAVIRSARMEMVDYAEAALRSAVLEKEAWAVTLVLRTIGKNRGYVERSEHEMSGRNGEAIEIKATDYRVAVAPLSPGSMGDSAAPGESEGDL